MTHKGIKNQSTLKYMIARFSKCEGELLAVGQSSLLSTASLIIVLGLGKFNGQYD